MATELALELARTKASAETERLRRVVSDAAGARTRTLELTRAGSATTWGAPAVTAVVLALFAF